MESLCLCMNEKVCAIGSGNIVAEMHIELKFTVYSFVYNCESVLHILPQSNSNSKPFSRQQYSTIVESNTEKTSYVNFSCSIVN